MSDTSHPQQKERRFLRSLQTTIYVLSASSRSKRSAKQREKRAKESAKIVRNLIVGPTSISPTSTKSPVPSGVQRKKVESELTKPKSAENVILQLRNLDLVTDASSSLSNQPGGKKPCPIHAVCLDKTDEVVQEQHFADLKLHHVGSSVATANLDSNIKTAFKNLHIMNLIENDFGFGQPASSHGILAGAVPTPKAIMTGIEIITPQLMSLGYVTGRAISPDHTGICPPTDRMSVLTYWWGFELLLPTSSIANLRRATSISNTAINFLTALSAINGGVREILPFIRYISNFLQFEFDRIREQDKGIGVVCTATWLVPIALVPHPWDFPLPPTPTELLMPHDESEDELSPISAQDGSPQISPPSAEDVAIVNPMRPPSDMSTQPSISASRQSSGSERRCQGAVAIVPSVS